MNAEFIERLDRIGKELRKLVADMKAAESTACGSHTNELAKLEEEFGKQARILVETLALFNVDATVQRVEKGPTVDRVVFTVPPGTRYSKVTTLKDNLTGACRTPGVRIEAPVFGEDALAAEMPHDLSDRTDVDLVSLLRKGVPKGCDLPLFIGKTIAGEDLVADLSTMPHLLIGGATGQGKTTLLNSIICGLIANFSKDELQLLLYDEKMVEFAGYNGLPHLYSPVETDPSKFHSALQGVVLLMEKRLKIFAQARQRNIVDYNCSAEKKFPYIVIIADEVGEALTECGRGGDEKYRIKRITEAFTRISAMGRAAGIHLIIATQSVDTKVLSGLLKANIPGRIAFKTANSMDSRTILDEAGAEDLIGRGDMLFRSKNGQLIRAQGAIVPDMDIATLVNMSTKSEEPQGLSTSDIAVLAKMGKKRNAKSESKTQEAKLTQNAESLPPGELQSDDEDCEKAIEVICDTQRASVSQFQRKLGWGYNHASKILELLQERGIVGPQNNAGSRDIIDLPKLLEDRQRK